MNGAHISGAETWRTKRDQEILDLMRAYISRKGYAPSLRDVKDMARLSSTSVASSVVKRLAKKGLVLVDPEIPRSLRIIDENVDHCPTCGQVLPDSYLNRQGL